MAREVAEEPAAARRGMFGRRALGRKRTFRSRGARDDQPWLGSWLDRLPAGWYVFHDVPTGEGDARIDHVAVGPGGVLAIASKELAGRVVIGSRTFLHDGRRTDHLSRAVDDAKRAARCLSAAVGRPIRVEACIAVTADDMKIKPPPVDVFVDSPKRLERWLLQRPATLTDEQVAAIASVVPRRETWARPTAARRSRSA